MKHSWAGGSEMYIQELASHWVLKKNNVTLFCAQDPYQQLPEKQVQDGVTIYRKGGRLTVYFWALVYYLKYFRRSTDFVVDVENGIPFFTPLYCGKKKMCLVYHVHGKQFFYELPFPLNFVGFFLEQYIFPFIYRNIPLIAISESTKRELIKLGFKSKYISIISPGVSMDGKKAEKISKFKKPTLLYLGRIKKYKRLSILVEIFPEILKQFPNVRLIIAGWGSEAPIISDLIMKSKSRRNINIVGPVNEQEKRYLLSKSWIFINPSLHEGWGISVSEANLFGTPAVTFNVPGLSDAVIHKKTGFLSNGRNDMIHNINKLIKNDSLRKKMSIESRKRALELSWSVSADLSLSLIHRILKKKT